MIAFVGLFFDHGTDGHIKKAHWKVPAHIEGLKLESSCTVAISLNQEAVEHLNSNGILFDWVCHWVFHRVHVQDHLTLVLLAGQPLHFNSNERFPLRHQWQFESCVDQGGRAIFINFNKLLLHNILSFFMIFLEILKVMNNSLHFDVVVIDLGSTDDVATLNFWTLPSCVIDSTFVIHLLDPSKTLIVMILFVKVPEELFTSLTNIAVIHILLA